MRSFIYPVTTETAADTEGGFQAELTDIRTNFPIAGATVSISSLDDPSRPVEVLQTDSAGFTPFMNIPAPPYALSQEPSDVRPYSEYVLDISAPGYEPIRISGAEILAGVTAKQQAQMLPSPSGLPDSLEEFVIPDHTLYGSYPPKIAEAEVKETISSGEIVLPSVVIPEYVIVHDGTPNNRNARNYTVKLRKQLK